MLTAILCCCAVFRLFVTDDWWLLMREMWWGKVGRCLFMAGFYLPSSLPSYAMPVMQWCIMKTNWSWDMGNKFCGGWLWWEVKWGWGILLVGWEDEVSFVVWLLFMRRIIAREDGCYFRRWLSFERVMIGREGDCRSGRLLWLEKMIIIEWEKGT